MTGSLIIGLLSILCCAAPGSVATAQAGEQAGPHDGSFLLARQLRRIPESDQVCCVRAGRRSRTSKEACRRALGTVRPVSECGVTVRERVGCCRIRRRPLSWKKPSDCRRLEGQIVSSAECVRIVGDPRFERVCCRTSDGRLMIVQRRGCRTILPHRQCALGRNVDIGPSSATGRTVCCAARNRGADGRRIAGTVYRTVPLLNCLSDGGREVKTDLCRYVCCQVDTRHYTLTPRGNCTGIVSMRNCGR